MKKILQLFSIVAFTMFMGLKANSQISNYSFSESTGNTFSSISGSGTAVSLVDDGDAQVNIGFTFTYNGSDYTQVNIGSNGYMAFGSNSATSYSNDISSTSSGKMEVVAPFWDDLDPTSGGNVYYLSQGSSPNRTLIIEYNAIPKYGGGATLMAQIVLYESSFNIELKYGASSGSFSSGSIGINESPGGSSHYISVTPGSPASSSTTTAANSLTAAPADGVNYLFTYTPPSCPNPSGQSESSVTTTSASLDWTENGSATQWNIEYGAAGFTQGNGTTVSVSSKPYSLSGLTSNTSYDWYVQTDCGSGSTSSWIGPSTFKTPQVQASVQSLPFSEDWESNSLHIGTIWNTDAGSVCTIQTSTASKNAGTYGLEQYGNSSSGFTTPSDLADAKTKAVSGGDNEDWTTWNRFSVDLSSVSNPWLSFYYALGYKYNDNYNNFWVQVSTDGTTWTDLFSTQTNGADIAYNKKPLDLSAYNGTSQLYIRFFHNGKYSDNYLYLDNIEVKDVTCPDPTAQTETNKTLNSADLGWTENGSATQWDIEYGAAGFTQGSGTTVSVTANPYNLSGLTANTSYDWYVRANCGSGSTSSWTGPSNFSTSDGKANNPTPTDNAINIALSSTTLDWDDVTNATGYHISVGTSSGATDVVNNVAISGVTNSTYTVSSNWSPNQDYYWTITTDYSGGQVTGDEWSFLTVDGKATNPVPTDNATGVLITAKTLDWDDVADATGYHISVGTSSGGTDIVNNVAISGGTSSSYTVSSNWSYSTVYYWKVTTDFGSGVQATGDEWSFTSECGTYSSFPYTEDFSSWAPMCWDVDHTSTGSTDDWINYSSSAAEANFWGQSSGKTDIMISPTFDVSGLTTPVIDFNWSHKYNSSYPDDSLSVEITDDGGTNWHQIWTKGGSKLESNDGAGDTAPGSYINSGDIDISAYGNTIQIRFFATSGYGPNLYVDNFRVREKPTCPDPTAQTETNITISAVDLGWTENGSATQWDIEYGAAGFTQGSGTTVSVTANPYSLSGLSANTSYDWYVRANCGSGSTSSWTGPHNFSTAKYSKVTTGKTTKCSPHFARDGGSGSFYFYDKYSFTVPTSDNYDIIANWTQGSETAYDGYLYLYENSFDPSNPATNKIGYDDDNDNGNGSTHGSKIAGQALNSGTTYIVVGTSYSDNQSIGTMEFKIEGSYTATANATADYNGIQSGPTHSITATDGTSYSSEYGCDDSQGWTNYYDESGSASDYSDDKLLLSVKRNGNDFGATTVTVAGAAGSSFISASSSFSKYVNSFSGWYVFNRYWVLSPTTQPSSDVQVRFYYQTADFNDLNTALNGAGRSTIANRTDMSIYKINDLSSSGYDPDPANNHVDIPKASAYDADGAWIYSPPTSSTSVNNAKWADGSYESDYYFEFTVAHFSGGGGGAAGTSDDGSLPIKLLSFNAFANGDINQVIWETAIEMNVDKFIIERMNPETQKIEQIGEVKAVGNSNKVQSYSFNDTKPLDKAYYRIRNIDNDGATETYNWVYVKRGNNEFRLLNLYPNPAQNTVHIDIVNPSEHNTHLEIRDMVGKIIFTKDYSTKTALQNIDINLSEISAGTYYLSIDNSKNRIIKMLIIK